MIRANHKNWADRAFGIYIRGQFRKHFHAFHLLGTEPMVDENLPLILVPNHSSWWDGFFVYHLNKTFFQRKLYLMMLESQLKRYPFFQKLGAFSIDQKNPKKILDSLKYSTLSLKMEGNNCLLTIFPQGELLPDYAALKLNNGLEKVISWYGAKLNVLPLSMKIIHLKEQRPQFFFSFGKNIIASKNDFSLRELKLNLEKTMAHVRESILNNEHGKIIFKGKRSAGGHRKL